MSDSHPTPTTAARHQAGPRATAIRAQAGLLVLLSYVLSWVPWIVLARSGTDVEEGAGFLVFALAASGPTLAAIALWLLRLRPCVRNERRASWRGVLAASLLGIAAPALTAVLFHDLGTIGEHAAETLTDVGGPVAALAYTLISGPLAEEFGWRGYLQPRVRRLAGRVRTTLVIGVVWACWHLPLFWIDGTSQQERGVLSMGGLTFVVQLVAISYLMLVVVEDLRGGVTAAITLHATWNLTDALTPTSGTGGDVVKCLLFVGTAVVAAGLVSRSRGALGVRRPAPSP